MRRRAPLSAGMLYAIAGILVVASAQSFKVSSPATFYVMMGIGGLVCAIGILKLLRSNG